MQRTNLFFEACAQCGHVDIVTFESGVVSQQKNCSILYAESDGKTHYEQNRWLKFKNMLTPWNPYSMFPKDSFRASVIKRFVERKTYDLILCRYIPSAMECGLFDYSNKLVIDVDDNPLDVERIAAKTSRTLRNRLYHHYRSIVIGRAIRIIQNKCRFTFYSNPEQNIYRNSAYLPNIPFYDYDMEVVNFQKSKYRILFVGNLSYGPNCLGILHFIKKIFPLIRETIPDAELHLVGGCNNDSFLRQCRAVDGVKYMGFVENLEEEYYEARVVAVPIYSGAGTNIKILEAMKMRRPCVTTNYGIRGFKDYFENGRDIFIADTDRQFANAIMDMLCDETKNHNMSHYANLAVSTHFSRDVFNGIVKQNLLKC